MRWLALLALVIMTGCMQTKPMPLDDGYQVGDVMRTAIALQDEFCNSGDPVAEALLLMALDEVRPVTGDENLCEIDVVEFVRSQ